MPRSERASCGDSAETPRPRRADDVPRETAVRRGFVTADQFDACTSADAVSRLGFSAPRAPADEGGR